MGMSVSGSDARWNDATDELRTRGATVYATQVADNLTKLQSNQLPDVVLISSAVPAANEERRAADQLGLPVVKRNDFLPALLQNRTVIAVAGTHGKSTTTAMIITLLRQAGMDPGFIVGATLPGLGNAAAGTDDAFVIEADEYDRMFHGLHPAIAVITNVEWDHPDCYPTPSSFHKAFMQFVDQVDRSGLIVSCMDDAGAEQLHAHCSSRGPKWITYGLAPGADLRAVPAMADDGAVQAELTWWHAPTGVLRLATPGVHNIQNAMAALVVGSWCGVPISQGAELITAYTGVERRFEHVGDANGVHVYDDYAHHPTEIAATLSAARERYPSNRIWAVFQPHTFSRTQKMLYRMGESFGDADEVIVTDIYAARESDDNTVSAKELVVCSPHSSIRHIAALSDVVDYLQANVNEGDVVITLGAGDVDTVGQQLLAIAKGEGAS